METRPAENPDLDYSLAYSAPSNARMPVVHAKETELADTAGMHQDVCADE